MKAWVVPVAVSLVAGCSSGPHRLKDGSYKLDCDKKLTECLRRAKTFCGDQGYQIVQGNEENTLVGVEGHKTGHLLARVVFYCAGEAPARPLKLPPRAPASPAAAEPERVCVPGSTQRCIGPGACEGGQACLKDGSGYGPCECAPGPAASPSSAAETPEPQ
jgi:hypothetical protein